MLRYPQVGLSLDEIISEDHSVITAADVQVAAQKYMSKDIYYQETVLPTKEKNYGIRKGAAEERLNGVGYNGPGSSIPYCH